MIYISKNSDDLLINFDIEKIDDSKLVKTYIKNSVQCGKSKTMFSQMVYRLQRKYDMIFENMKEEVEA